MLGLAVRRLKLAAVVALALLTAGQLALHNHPLVPDSTGSGLVCGVCAFSCDDSAAGDPKVESLEVLASLLPLTERFVPSAVPLSLTTRGPPQA